MIIHLNPGEILNIQLFCYCSITLTLIENNPDIIEKFVKALQKGLDYTYSHSSKEIASSITNYFPDTSLNDLEQIVKRYIDIDSWYKTTYIDENDFKHVQEIMKNSKQLDKEVPYDKLVNNKY